MAYPGFQRGGCLSTGPIRKAGGGGGGGGGAVGFWPDTKSGGGVLSVSGPIRKAGGGGGRGVLLVSGPIQKAGGGGRGGGCCRFLVRYEKRRGGGVLLVWPNTSAYLECAGGGC